MSNYDPYSSDHQSPVRHRRSDRHRRTGESSSDIPNRLPEEQEEAPREIQWQRREPPTWQDENAEPSRAAYSRRYDSSQDGGLYMRHSTEQDDDYDDEEDVRRFPWLKILGIVLAAVVLFFAALFFMKDAGPLNPLKNAITGLISAPVKAAGEVLSFQAASSTGSTGIPLESSMATISP